MTNIFISGLNKKLAFYRDQWLHIGTTAPAVNRDRISGLLETIYTLSGFEKPRIIRCDSPLATVKKMAENKSAIIFEKLNQIIDVEWENIYKYMNVLEQNRNDDWDNCGLADHSEDEIPCALFILRPFRSISLIEKEINEQSIDASEGAKTLQEKIAFCGFFERELGVRLHYSMQPLFQLCENCSWWIPCEKEVYVSENPIRAHFRSNEYDAQLLIPVLHHDGGPALLYPDGFAVYALNGIRVPREISVTPHSKLDPRLILREPNADVRREIVRKIGIERICRDMNAQTIDRFDDYELIVLDIGDGKRRPYLKMKNPSIGVYHIEGVPPMITTVKEALSWRNGTDAIPSAIS